jgi:hypothetical protein
MTSAWTVGTRPPEWVVCRGAVRPILGGEVICPMAGKAIPLATCPTCRWLEDADEDRFAAWTCSAETGGATATARTRAERPDETASLVIELL